MSETKTVTDLIAEGFHQLQFGRVALCSKGRVGVITGRKKLPWGWSYIGIGINRDEDWRWAARRPWVVAENLNDFLRRERLLLHYEK